jgi:hypothetical protein
VSKTTIAEKKDLASLIDGAWKVAGAAEGLELLHPNDLTVQRYAARYEMSENHARTLLERLVKKGELVKIQCRYPDKAGMVLAFRKA